MKLDRKPLSYLTALTLAGTVGLSLFPTLTPLRAADHGDSPSVDSDSGADIADAFLFLDPNDNTRVIIAMTVHGFIVPGEAPSFATFDSKVLFELNVENTGDAAPDMYFHVTFGDKTASTSTQTATVSFGNYGTGGEGVSQMTFTAPTTPSTFAATPNPQTVTTDPASGIKFFAGEVDDPFFFDLVAFNRFVASVKAGAPDPTVFNRGRDVFAGYNILAIAMSMPVSMLKGSASAIGLEARTKRMTQTPSKEGGFTTTGAMRVVDRTGNPAVNVALIPFARKDEYNAAKPQDDAKGQFANDIVASLKSFGTDDAHVAILAGIAVTHGDYLHMDPSIANTGAEGGINPEAGFPNGRRLADDVIDTILTVINNGNKLGDNVNASDVLPQDVFPFFGLPHQPEDTGVVDDNTRN